MTANKPICTTRGKKKVNGLRKPKKKGEKPNGSMTASKSIGIARREVTRTKAQGTRWVGTSAKPMSKPMGK